MNRPATLADIDLGACHQLAAEVRAAGRLVHVAAELIEEILDRYLRIEARIDELNGDDPGFGSPTRMDRILELSGKEHLSGDLMRVADDICVAVGQETPSFGSAWAAQYLEMSLNISALKAEIGARVER